MKIIRTLPVAAVAALALLLAIVPTPAIAGTAQSPEISDATGDSDSGKASRDVIAAWFSGETDLTLNITMNTSALETYTNPADIQNAPTTEYEVYFGAKDKFYAVACKVPVHGPLGALIQFDLRSVIYGNGTNTTETSIRTLSDCAYTPSTHNIRWMVAKADIGDPLAGSHLTNTWAAVYNRNFGDSVRRIEDRAPNLGYGRDYIVRGSAYNEILRVDIEVENSTLKTSPAEPAKFRLNLFNNGTSQVNVEMQNGTMTKGWNCSFSLDSLTISQNTSRVVYVTVTPPRTVKNGTVDYLQVRAQLRSGNQTANTSYVSLSSIVNYIAPPPPAPGGNPLTKFVDWMKTHTKETAAIFVVIIIVSIGAVVAVSRKSKKLDVSETRPIVQQPSKTH